MRPPPTNCPCCNSIQKFAVRRRVVGGRIESYIRCSMCKTETIIGLFTHEDLKLRRKLARERGRKISDARRS